MNLNETQVMNRKAMALAVRLRRANEQAQTAAENYRDAWRVLIEAVDVDLHTSTDPVDHAIFTETVQNYFRACQTLAAYPCCGIAILDRIEWDEYAAMLTASVGFRVQEPQGVA